MIIYGVAIGFLTVVIRLFGAYPEGCHSLFSS